MDTQLYKNIYVTSEHKLYDPFNLYQSDWKISGGEEQRLCLIQTIQLICEAQWR